MTKEQFEQHCRTIEKIMDVHLMEIMRLQTIVADLKAEKQGLIRKLRRLNITNYTEV